MNETTDQIEVLDDIEDDYAEQFLAPEGFRVHDEDTANWVIRKVIEARARAERMREVKRRADAEIKAAQKAEAFFLGKFGDELQTFLASKIAGQKVKSYKMLEGTLGTRKSAESLLVFDEEQAIEWAEKTGVAYRVLNYKISVNKTDLMKEFRESGEQPDGTVYQPEKEVLYVK